MLLEQQEQKLEHKQEQQKVQESQQKVQESQQKVQESLDLLVGITKKRKRTTYSDMDGEKWETIATDLNLTQQIISIDNIPSSSSSSSSSFVPPFKWDSNKTEPKHAFPIKLVILAILVIYLNICMYQLN